MVTIGRITDEGVENLGSRLGSYYKGGPTLVEITEDAIYNYAVDNGDANPLYVDPGYASRSRFGGLIAPPAIVDVIKHYTAGMVGGLPGVHQFHSGNDVTFYRPIRIGDRIGTVYRPYKMSEKEGRFAGRMISIDVIIWYFNQRGEIVAKAHGPCFRVERRQARERGKYKEVEKTRYTEAELQTIWDAYDREELRGDTPPLLGGRERGRRSPDHRARAAAHRRDRLPLRLRRRTFGRRRRLGRRSAHLPPQRISQAGRASPRPARRASTTTPTAVTGRTNSPGSSASPAPTTSRSCGRTG